MDVPRRIKSKFDGLVLRFCSRKMQNDIAIINLIGFVVAAQQVGYRVLWGLIAVYLVVRITNEIVKRATKTKSTTSTGRINSWDTFQLSPAISISTLLCAELLLRITLGAAQSRAWQAHDHPLVNKHSTYSQTELQVMQIGSITICVCAVLLITYSRVLCGKHTSLQALSSIVAAGVVATVVYFTMDRRGSRSEHMNHNLAAAFMSCAFISIELLLNFEENSPGTSSVPRSEFIRVLSEIAQSDAPSNNEGIANGGTGTRRRGGTRGGSEGKDSFVKLMESMERRANEARISGAQQAHGFVGGRGGSGSIAAERGGAALAV